jgi:hypothetical protein
MRWNGSGSAKPYLFLTCDLLSFPCFVEWHAFIRKVCGSLDIIGNKRRV